MQTALLIIAMLIFSASTSHERSSRTHVVTITALSFEPQSLEIDFRDTVLWINKSSRTHQIIDERGSFRSPVLTRHDSFYHVFRKSGVFAYYCKRHRKSGIKGTVRVSIH